MGVWYFVVETYGGMMSRDGKQASPCVFFEELPRTVLDKLLPFSYPTDEFLP